MSLFELVIRYENIYKVLDLPVEKVSHWKCEIIRSENVGPGGEGGVENLICQWSWEVVNK